MSEEFETGRARVHYKHWLRNEFVNQGGKMKPEHPSRLEVQSGIVPYCWISPQGEFYPVPSAGHSIVAARIWMAKHAGEAPELGLAERGLELKGWIKLMGGDITKYFFMGALYDGPEPTDKQLKVCLEIIDLLTINGQSNVALDLQFGLGGLFKNYDEEAANDAQ